MPRYDNVTFVMCLPRSRSAWLTQFLKPVAWTMHDPLKQCESIDELGCKIDTILSVHADQPMLIADTAAVLFNAAISARFINAKYLFVRRPTADVAKSLGNAGIAVPHELLERYDTDFERALLVCKARRDLMLEVDYSEINQRLLNIWRFVGNANLLSSEYAERMKGHNIQIPFAEQRAKTDIRKAKRLLSSIAIRINS